MSNYSLQPNPNMTVAYTNGACRGNPGQGGFGTVIVLSNGKQIDICGGENNSTNNRMELMGAIHAVEHSPKHIPLQIWTDSNYVQQGITSWIHRWKQKSWKNIKNVDLWQRLDTACQNRDIHWHWLKGHAGHIGNEYADNLANQGIDNLPTTFNKKIFMQTSSNSTSNHLPTDGHSTLSSPTNLPLNPPEEEGFNQLFFISDDNTDEDLLIEDTENLINHPPIIDSRYQKFLDDNGNFLAQNDELVNARPIFDGVTSHANSNFIPLLPIAKNHGVASRQLILDTETTGLEPLNGDRIIEIGIIELVNRRFTGEKLHVYINPERHIEEESLKVHGITEEFLANMPTFAQIGQVVFDFLQGAELIAHNANFDMGFLQMEFERLQLPNILDNVTVTDSLAIARKQYAGQRNTLDALVRRLNVGKKDRTFHGALLDAEILAEVYLAMTGGQVTLAIDDDMVDSMGVIEHTHFSVPVKYHSASDTVEQAHQQWLTSLANKYPKLTENWDFSNKIHEN